MAYQGSTARRLDLWDEEDPLEGQSLGRRQDLRRFRTFEGGHLDADARRGVSPQFVARLRAIAVVVVFLAVLCCVRVALSAGTVTLMRQNNKVESNITQLREENKDLQVTRSVLSSADRITRIAQQNYGMVQVTPSATIDVSD
ncbi:MAG: cell division protein FtsL [Atopobiaceae bacterium]